METTVYPSSPLNVPSFSRCTRKAKNSMASHLSPLSSSLVDLVPKHTFRLSLFNTRSILHKADMLLDIFDQLSIDILCITESWHSDSDDLAIRRLCRSGCSLVGSLLEPTGVSTGTLQL